MLLWVFVLFILSLTNLVLAISIDQIDGSVMQLMALLIMLNATGILYRIYFKARTGQTEALRARVRELEERIGRAEGSTAMPDASRV